MSESVAPATTPRQSLPRQLVTKLGTENIGLLLALVAVIVFFGVLSPRFLSMATFDSVAFQLPELGLLQCVRAGWAVYHTWYLRFLRCCGSTEWYHAHQHFGRGHHVRDHWGVDLHSAHYGKPTPLPLHYQC
jgi:hypothetical protein